MRGLPLGAARFLLAAVYAVIKLVTRVDTRKVVFLGRRTDRLPLDFRLIIDELRRRDPEVKVTVLSKLVTGGDQREVFPFALVLLRSLYHLATSKIGVLDSYWPAVSLFPHRRELVVYQIWHALGKIKKSGKQALGRTQGRDEHLARGMRMHEGYDYVVAGAEIWNPQYCASFGVAPAQLLNIGLPRADYLVNERTRVAARIADAYPELMTKPIVVYAPTFRRGERARGALELARVIDLDRFNLVIKKHESDTLLMPPQRHFACPEFTGTQMLTVADFVVTDYSSIALEAALIDVKTFYFLYDHERYLEGNGVNIDLDTEMPGCVFREPEALRAALAEEYPMDVLRRYREKFVLGDPGHSTTDLVDHIVAVGGLCIR